MSISIQTIKDFKKSNKKIIALTAYDYTTAKLLDGAGVDIVLVGDSLAQVALGYENTLSVTVDEMLHHTKAVKRGIKNALLVVDLPFLSYQVNEDEAILNAGRCLQVGAHAVKVEGASENILNTISRMVEAGIPVLGHIGFTPQSINAFGGVKVQGKTNDAALLLLKDAQNLEKAGCFGVVLELVPSEVGKLITEDISIPTIGIGAGRFCNGQILVTDDLVGKFMDFKPSFVKRYAEIGKDSLNAIKSFISDVQNHKYPDVSESYFLTEGEAEKLNEK